MAYGSLFHHSGALYLVFQARDKLLLNIASLDVPSHLKLFTISRWSFCETEENGEQLLPGNQGEHEAGTLTAVPAASTREEMTSQSIL